jgi:hypothetical protein
MAIPGARLWLFACVVPLIALAELGLHARQAAQPALDADLAAARAWVVARQQPTDAVVFAPPWIDPLGRKAFAGTQTNESATFADATRFARIFEVSTQGASAAELASPNVAEQAQFGAIRVRLAKSVQHAPTAIPFTQLQDPTQLQVKVAASEAAGGAVTPCDFARSGGSGGNWSPPTAPAQFACGFGAVSRVVLPMLDYRPRSCLFAPTPGGSKRLVLRFANVHFQQRIAGHHGLMVQAERGLEGADVTLEAFVDAELPNQEIVHRSLGSAVHRDGDGWAEFGFATPKLAGQIGDLTIEVQSLAAGRQYCFDADTR